MAALDFPDNPAVGDMYGSESTVWRWDGTAWNSTAGTSGPQGVVGFKYVQAAQSGIVTDTDIGGLITTFTAIPGRVYKVTVEAYVGSTVANDLVLLKATDGVGSQLMSTLVVCPVGGGIYKGHLEVVLTACPAGPYTVKVMAARYTGTGTVTLTAGNGHMAFLLVEDITYEAGSSGTPQAFSSGGGGGPDVGLIMSWSADTIPDDLLICDGQAVPAGAEYDELRGLVGANVPDLRDKFLLGASATKAIRTAGGAETHTLSVAEIPSHNHPVEGPDYHPWGVVYGGATGATTFAFAPTYVNSAVSFGNLRAKETGGSAAHNNMPPWYAVVYVIQAKAKSGGGGSSSGGGGSGFTFVQDSKPTAAKQGDTWFNTATGAGGGRSCVAIDEGSGELVWVQFSPATSAGVQPSYCEWQSNANSAAPVPSTFNTTTPIPFSVELRRRGLTRSGSRVTIPDDASAGLYLCTLVASWWPAVSWPTTATGYWQLRLAESTVAFADTRGLWDGNITTATLTATIPLRAGNWVEPYMSVIPASAGVYHQGSNFKMDRVGLL